MPGSGTSSSQSCTPLYNQTSSEIVAIVDSFCPAGPVSAVNAAVKIKATEICARHGLTAEVLTQLTQPLLTQWCTPVAEGGRQTAVYFNCVCSSAGSSGGRL